MPLINCSDCGNEVSDKAPTCPKCGAPIAILKEQAATGTNIKTIQETSKRLKFHILISVFLIIVGAVWLIVDVNSPYGTGASPVSILLTVVGLFWYFVTRFRIWWHHK